MLPARHRLRASADFASAVRGPGSRRVGGRLVVLHVSVSGTRAGLPPRAGFVVSKAVGNAVLRNRTKRRLRAVVFGHLAELPAGTDVVVRANPAAAQASTVELDAAVVAALARSQTAVTS